jgi:hypothetical protein
MTIDENKNEHQAGASHMLKLLRWAGLLAICAGVLLSLTSLPSFMKGNRDFYLVDSKLEGQAFLDAIEQLKPDAIAAFEARETAAFLAEPLDSVALQNMTLLAGLRKDTELQEKLALFLPRYSRRNVLVQMTAANILVKRQDYAAAMLELDGMLRSHPEVGPEVFPILTSIAAQKEGVKALAKVLVQDPPWRWPFIQKAITSDSEAQAAYGLFAAVRQEKGDVYTYEIRQLVTMLVRAGKIDKAYFIWLDFLKDADLRLVQSVFDGDFDRDSQNMQFDWTIVARKNARIAIENRRGSAVNRNLVLDFAADKGAFNNVKQLLVLSPGNYTMSLEYMAQSLKTEKGLVWAVRCADNKVLGKSVEFKDTGPWAQYSFPFTVPEEACATQLLSLESASTAVLDTPISGQMYFDSIKIQNAATAKEVPKEQ